MPPGFAFHHCLTSLEADPDTLVASVDKDYILKLEHLTYLRGNLSWLAASRTNPLPGKKVEVAAFMFSSISLTCDCLG